MTNGRTIAALALTALLGVTACGNDAEPETPPAAGEQAAPMQGQQMDPEMMALMSEAQELQQQLAPIQEEAMQDEALSQQLEEIQLRIETAMEEESPELFNRMQELEGEFMAAQAEGDEAKVQEISMEAQTVQMELQSVQQSVLARPDIREPIDAFEEAHRARMLEIDPQVEELMARLDEILEEAGLR